MMAATNVTRRPTADVSDIMKYKPDGAVGGKKSPDNNLYVNFNTFLCLFICCGMAAAAENVGNNDAFGLDSCMQLGISALLLVINITANRMV